MAVLRDDDTTGTRIRYFRKHAGLTQADLAELMGITRKKLWQFEYDHFSPTLAQAQRLAKILQVSLKSLVPEHATPLPSLDVVAQPQEELLEVSA